MKVKHESTKEVRVRKLVNQRKKKLHLSLKKKTIRINHLTTRHPLQVFFPLDTYIL